MRDREKKISVILSISDSELKQQQYNKLSYNSVILSISDSELKHNLNSVNVFNCVILSISDSELKLLFFMVFHS